MIWDAIRGHTPQREMFRRSINRGRMSHGYLFLGPEGIGKRAFAKTLCQCLLCERCDDAELDACGECAACRRMQAGTHPDFLSIARPEGKNELPIELIAGSRDRRGREGLCHDLSLRPMAGHRKLAIIDDADRMNAESANALLKTLEEPPSYCTLLMIAADANALLPTIRSRCQQIRFSPLADADVAEILVDLGMVETPAEARRLAELSNGSLATAAQLLDPQLRKMRDMLYASLAEEPFDSIKTSLHLIEGLEEIGGDAPAQRQAAIWLIRFLIEFFRRVLWEISPIEPLGDPGDEVSKFVARMQPATVTDLELLAQLVDRTALAEAQINRMSPVSLCLEGLMNDLGKMLRTVVLHESSGKR